MAEDKGLLIFGGDIYTGDDNCPDAEAVAIKDSRIIEVGSLEKCRQSLGDLYDTLNLSGKTLMPGFIDTHMHPLMLIYYKMNADMRGVKDFADLKSRLQKIAEKTEPGSWIVGLDFDEQDLGEARLPKRYDLDEMCGDHPVLLIKHDGHMVIANTLAIKASGIDADSPDPYGGIIDRDENGFPEGPFRETAAQLVKDNIPFPEMDQLLDGTEATSKLLFSQGITSVGGVFQTDEDGPAGKAGAMEIMAMSMLLEQFGQSIYSILFASSLDNLEMAKQSGLHQKDNDKYKVGALKLIADGSFGSCTAYMNEPFSDQPDKSGILLMDEDELYRRMKFAHNAGYQIAIHAIGDKGVELCVNLYEKLLKEFPREDHRHRIEHASLINNELFERIKKLGLVISTQPLFIDTEKEWLEKRLGEKRLPNTYPFKSIVESGIVLAGASDAPVESTDVLKAIQCCVTREGFQPKQCISVEQAIRMYTINAAYAQFEENIKGSISVGKRADFIVLDKNPLKVLPTDIEKIKIEKTFIEGNLVFSNDPDDDLAS